MLLFAQSMAQYPRGIIKVLSSEQFGTLLRKLCCWKSRGWGSGAQSKATLELTANSGLRYCSIAQRGNNKGSRLALRCNAWPASVATTKVNDLKAGGRIKLQDCNAATLLTVWFAWIKFYICGDLEASLLVVSSLRTSLNKSKYNKNKYNWLLQTNVGQNHNVVSLLLCVNQLCSELTHQFSGVGRGRKAYIRYLTLDQGDVFLTPKN